MNQQGSAIISDIRNLAGALRDGPMREAALRVLEAVSKDEIVVRENAPSEAVYAFAAWLTTRPKPLIIGSNHDVAPVAELVNKFCISQRWANPRDGWEKNFQPYPSDA